MNTILSFGAVACLAVILLVGINFTYQGTFALQWESVSPYTGEIIFGRLLVALMNIHGYLRPNIPLVEKPKERGRPVNARPPLHLLWNEAPFWGFCFIRDSTTSLRI